MRNIFIAFIVLLVVVLFLGCGLEAAKKNTVEKPINDVKTTFEKEVKQEPKKEDIVKETPKETRKTIKKSGRTPQLVEELEGNKTLQVHFLNVGHGDSILVIAPNGGTMLIDGGYKDQPRIIMKYLEDLGINYLDVMLLTHAHDENVGGLDLILKKLGFVYRVYDSGYPSVNNTRSDEYESYKSFLKIAEKKEDYEILKENKQILIDEDVLVEFFVPYKDGFFEDLDDDSIVTRIDYGDVDFLLMGDCEFECEKKIMVNDIDVDILKVAHNGADDATSVDFLEKVNPQLAIISTGEFEKFHHPGQGLLDRLKNIKTMRTDIDGNIVVETDGKDFRVFINEPVQLQEFDYT